MSEQSAIRGREPAELKPVRDDLDLGDRGLFAERLEELFRSVPDPTGRRYTGSAIARKSSELGYKLGESYLSQLRSGKARTPSFRTVEGIAAAFGVDVRYFLEDAGQRRSRDEIDMMRLQADRTIREAAHRLAGLPESSIVIVNELIKVLRVQQGLPADPVVPAPNGHSAAGIEEETTLG
ncbi:helix-turn-helix domain-containing protein [Hoyosella sp. YIM 151337]|uniref:helix-turn-helix domain-containing protein n=1 Tax=Hoyosella sp. YIM 151337 TaxID=2992742 RepID=UPI0035A95973